MKSPSLIRFIFWFYLLASSPVVFSQSPESTGTLLRTNFDDTAGWVLPPDLRPGAVGVTAGPFGTIDVEGTTEGSSGLMLVQDAGARDGWTAAIQSEPLAVKNSQTDLGQLTLAFSLSASRPWPVMVRIESLDAAKQPTGALETSIHPAAADFYQRYALDLATMKPSGEGTFDPTAPFLRLSFSIGSALGSPAMTRHRLQLDNVHYAKPAFYVSPDGDDTRDGRTETTSLATPQKAIEAALPGDIIVLKNGTYDRPADSPERTPVARFVRSGEPSGWITLKNFPEHSPVLSAHGQNAVNISSPRWGSPNEEMALGYIEVRGLHVRGNGDTAREKFPEEIGKSTPNTSMQGIVVNGRKAGYPAERRPGERIHHVRLADNVVEFCTSDGIYAEYVDWFYVEDNVIKDNCWTTVGYAPAGLAVMGFANFDEVDNVTKMLIEGNRVSGNRLYVMNHPYGRDKPKTGFFNGNGMLLDANAESPAKTGAYRGRTLVANNVVFNNGGGGIQMWGNHRMDVVNNTVYHNGATPELKWGQIGFERTRDVRLINNIIVAQPDRPLDSWMVNRPDRGTDQIFRANNLYWGGAEPNIAGSGDIVADPKFVNATTDAATADFRLQADSPALGSGRWEIFAPTHDVDGAPRPALGPPDRGAFQK